MQLLGGKFIQRRVGVHGKEGAKQFVLFLYKHEVYHL